MLSPPGSGSGPRISKPNDQSGMNAQPSASSSLDVSSSPASSAHSEEEKLKYLDGHNVYALVDGALQKVLDELPADPYEALAKYFIAHSSSSSTSSVPKR